MLRIRDIMADNPATANKDTPIEDAARMMVRHNCGSVPVVERSTTLLVGILTDRDIVARLVARGSDSTKATVAEAMSTPVIALTPNDNILTAAHEMRRQKVRRLPVVDSTGVCIGIVTQSQVARALTAEQAGELLTDLSEKTASPSEVETGVRA